MLGHLYGTQGYPHNPFTKFIGHFAHLGVQIFFVISGFLITSLLIKEHNKNGKIDSGAFFTRRTLRIFPAAFVYILAMELVFNPGYLGYAFTYTMCYAPQTRPWILGHLWSLSVEEQFYLFWPLALVISFRHHTRTALVVIGLSIVARLLFWSAGLHEIDEYFPAVADNLMMGCLLAFYQGWLRLHAKWLLKPAVFSALAVLTFATPYLLPWVRLQIFFGAIVPFILAIFLFAAIERRDFLLNNKITSAIGVLSYSLYLWQQPFLNRTNPVWWTRFPLNILLAVMCAIFSFAFIENTLLNIYKRRRSA